MGVLIFFVHTSLVLMLSLERTKLEGRQLFSAFYLRRAFRIYSLSMVCVSIAMLLAVDQSGAARHWTWMEYASNMALTTNLTYSETMVGGLWTLPIEVQMYLVLPILFLIGRRYRTWVLAGLWLLAIPLALAQPHITGRLNVIGYAPCFLSGVLAWKLSRTTKRRFPGWLWPLGFVATWPFFLTASHEHDMLYRWAFCAVLGFVIPQFREMPRGVLRRVANSIATYSYGIYLTHLAAIGVAFSLPVPAVVQWLVFAGLAALLPWIAYHGVERPMINAGQRVARRLFTAVPRTVGAFSLATTPLP
jgi:peptidoglycan/LPS O-acetylase OafA/YrhL